VTAPAEVSHSQAAPTPPGRLRIIVCIKQVPKAQELQIDPVTKTLKRSGVPSEINPPDHNAIELALQLKDRYGADVTFVSMGPTSFDEALERAIAMGGDRGILLTDRALSGSDTVPTGYALSETIHKLGISDLILCGEETTDSSTGHVGPGIAGHLDLSQLTYIFDAEIVGRTVRAHRMVEDGIEYWEAPLPALLTVNFGCNKPREPTLSGKIRAKRPGAIVHWSAADVGLDPAKIGLKGSPTVVEKVETVKLPDRKGEMFTGPPREAVAALLARLRSEGLLAG